MTPKMVQVHYQHNQGTMVHSLYTYSRLGLTSIPNGYCAPHLRKPVTTWTHGSEQIIYPVIPYSEEITIGLKLYDEHTPRHENTWAITNTERTIFEISSESLTMTTNSTNYMQDKMQNHE